MNTDGAIIREDAGGSLSVEADGRELVTGSAPVMWDSSSGAASVDSAEGDEVGEVDASVAESSGDVAVSLTPDQAFLDDPDTQYPVTIDPTWTVGTSGDTYILNTGPGDSADTSLRVGTSDGGAHIRRAFVHFRTISPGAPWANTHITSASLVMHNWNSGSCAGANIRVARITEDWTVGNVTWANQPMGANANQVDFFPAYGVEPGCSNADATWDVTPIVKGWLTGAFPSYGLRVKALTETSNSTYRSYVSGNYNGGGDPHRPRIVINYNSYPDEPSDVDAWMRGGDVVTTTTLSDRDGGPLRATFAVLSGTDVVWTGTSDPLPSGAEARVTIPGSALVSGSTYGLRITADDGTDTSRTSYESAFDYDSTVELSPPTVTLDDCVDNAMTRDLVAWACMPDGLHYATSEAAAAANPADPGGVPGWSFEPQDRSDLNTDLVPDIATPQQQDLANTVGPVEEGLRDPLMRSGPDISPSEYSAEEFVADSVDPDQGDGFCALAAVCRQRVTAYIARVKGNAAYGNIRGIIGRISLELRNNLNGRQPRWTITVQRNSGPRINGKFYISCRENKLLKDGNCGEWARDPGWIGNKAWRSKLIYGNKLKNKNDYHDELNGWFKAEGYDKYTFNVDELKGYSWQCPKLTAENNKCFYPSDPDVP